jgi:uncharacterized membrane protein YqjE
MSKQLQWGGVPDSPPPKHPYRDTLVVYAGLALVIVLVAWVTGGDVRNAVAIAAVFYILASAWSITRWRKRIREQDPAP